MECLLATGLAASPGLARGRAFVVPGSGSAASAPPGCVLVVRSLSPDLVLAAINAAAIVAGVGGLTCHAAVIARELGVPCVVGIGQAIERVAPGASLVVDGSKGTVSLVHSSSGCRQDV